MPRKQSSLEQSQQNTETALEIVSSYVTALNDGDNQKMMALRSPGFVMDFVHGDVFRDDPLSEDSTREFWPAWFHAFPQGNFEVTRTIAAQNVIVTQWIFSGDHVHALGKPIMEPEQPPSGKNICFRGVSFYDIQDGSIQRETTYLDLATLMVELGIVL
ncbi:MAG: ester cyclase [Anaerolineaceae bacterium]|nr:ester cyclase [Anaerolineaceae bacterium]